jgi:hypothetical protein
LLSGDDGAAGLEKAIAAVWDGVPVQRCTVHKHRNLLAHAPPMRRTQKAGPGPAAQSQEHDPLADR